MNKDHSKPEYACEQCTEQLFDFVSNNLTELQHQRVDQHLQHCSDCSAELDSIWNLQRSASQWHDEAVPRWNKKQFFFAPSPWPLRVQWITSFASIVVLCLVMTEARISTADGLTLSFASEIPEQQFVSQRDLNAKLDSLQAEQNAQLNTSIGKLTSQQIATNQLLLRSVMDASRAERRDDLGNMLVLLEQQQQQRSQTTEESLRYLIAHQLQDRKEIEDLSDALLRVDTDRNY